jgi:flavin reductase (DIM6/NTAB) family NADH-FMN oxidoreductase RutF
MVLNLQQLSTPQKQNWLQHAIAPRPIALVSTVDRKGLSNLAPFSFFNLVSSNPPLVIFSPARRARDNSTKHSLENLYDVREAVVHIVTYEMVQQVSLASCEYPKETDEFAKAGFTKEAAMIVRPPMVKESPVKLECKVNEIKPLGKEGGSGNLVVAEVLIMHINESILNDDLTMIDQLKLNHVARLGGDWYCKVDKTNLFRLEKPNTKLGIGIDVLPEHIRNSKILSGNNLGQLANVHAMPVIDFAFRDDTLEKIVQKYFENPLKMELELHAYAKQLLDRGNVNEAWQILLQWEICNPTKAITEDLRF